MELTDQQLERFIELYKQELGIEITRQEAYVKATALLRFIKLMNLTTPSED